MIRDRRLFLLLLLAACGGEAVEPPRSAVREGRFGSLRDLVLFERAADLGGPFFLDRFEVTRADWRQFRGEADGSGYSPGEGEGSLPQTGVTLAEARAFAAWRCCRLPRADEWAYAATAGGRHPFPWGAAAQPSRANTAELGLGAATPVGTFESGRRAEGPYDLVGNAGEWSETVPAAWFRAEPWLDPPALAAWKLARTPALAVWLEPAWALPPVWLLQALGGRVPRTVMGSDFLSPMEPTAVARLPGDASAAQGLRLAADPEGLLLALARFPGPVTSRDEELLRRFLARPWHREALARAWPAVRSALGGTDAGSGPVARLLAEVLGS